MIPDVAVFIADANALYEEIRDLSRTDAVHLIAKKLLTTYGKGGESVFTDLQMRLLPGAAEQPSIRLVTTTI